MPLPSHDAMTISRRASFEAFAARKTAEVSSARLDAFVTDVEHAEGVLDPIGNEWSRLLLGGDFYASPPPDAARPACSLVFVQSRNGNTGANNPVTLGGGHTNKHVIYEGVSQVAADAVLCGATTIRNSAIVFGVWHPELVRLRAVLGKPRYPVQIVATLRGMDLDACLLFNVPDIRVIVLTTADGARAMREGLAARPWVKPLVMSQPDDLPAAFASLRTLGITRVSAVGGRRLATQLIDADLVQDVYRTTSARAGGEPGTPMYPGPLKARTLVSKHGTGLDSGVVFEHLHFEPRRSARARSR